MNIRGINIDTPDDDSADYSPKWRYEVANALGGCRGWGVLPHKIYIDPYIKEYCRYLDDLIEKRKRAKADDVNYYNKSKQFPVLSVILRWFDFDTGSLKHRIEALLLTDLRYDQIADIINTDAINIETYEKLFFNIRDNQGRTCYAPLLRWKFAAGNNVNPAELTMFEEWKVVAVQYGASGLLKYWGTDTDITDFDKLDSQLYQKSRSLVIKNVLKGKVSNYDLNQLQANNIANKRLLVDAGVTTEDGVNQEDKLSNQLLNVMIPRMVDISENAALSKLQAQAIEDKFATTKLISDVKVVDKGMEASQAAFTQEIRNKSL